ncbi:hypothetical protein ACIBLA_01675 [Streptomyces sp. NPDC050433]
MLSILPYAADSPEPTTELGPVRHGPDRPARRFPTACSPRNRR